MPSIPHIYRPKYWILLLLFGITPLGSQLFGQEDCECKPGDKITICYYSADRFCPPHNECRYTLDGSFMVNSLNRKLQNPNLFGSAGISKCPITLEVVDDVDSVGVLEQKECDIMFIGAFTGFFGGELEPTIIPESDLLNIKEWSTKCPANLTIVTQVEAAPWGYDFADLNVNPNEPDPNFTDYSIFNGTFGKVSSFTQGGGFQGIFTDYPNTGYSVLARDKNKEPTIVLDHLTNDIILGDIGMLCNGAGPLSPSPEINNDSDILACNLFDLGCKIVTNSTYEFAAVCEGDSYVSSGGQILEDEGIYVDSLINIHGCDSLIYTLLEVNDLYDTVYTQIVCDDADFTLAVGNEIYGINNTTGTEVLQSVHGCDSVVYIELGYFNSDTTYLQESFCAGDTIFVSGFPFTQSESIQIITANSEYCDSIVFIDVVAHEGYDNHIEIDLCPGEVFVASDGTVFAESAFYQEFHQSQYGCDSIASLHILLHEEYEEVETYIGCKGDGYTLKVGNNTYNEASPSGTEYLQSSKGCDSIIHISFVYQPLDTTYLYAEICPYETYEVGGVAYSGTTFESIALPSSGDCDSIILLDLETHDSEEIVLLNNYEVNLNAEFSFNIPSVDDATYNWSSDGTISCVDCPDPQIMLENLPSYLELIFTDEYECTYKSRAEISYRCTPFFPNVINLCSGYEENRYFKVKALCPLESYSLTIFDRWGSKVFASNDQSEPWDGSFDGKKIGQGVYVYSLGYTAGGFTRQVSGSVTLLH